MNFYVFHDRNVFLGNAFITNSSTNWLVDYIIHKHGELSFLQISVLVTVEEKGDKVTDAESEGYFFF